MTRRFAVARACAAAFVASAAFAASARADVDVRPEFGHGGAWVADAATPCVVTLRNTSAAPVEVTVVIRHTNLGGTDGLVVERTVALGANAVRDERFILPGPTAFSPDVRIDVATSPRTPVHSGSVTGDRGSLSIPLTDLRLSHGARPGEERAVGVIGDPGSVLSSHLSGREVSEKRKSGGQELAGARARLMAVDPRNVRLAPLALDGLESLVLVDPDASSFADPAELDALLDWVALGGRLVVSLGENAALFATSALAESMPARWGSVERGDYAELARQLDVNDPDLLPREGPRVRLRDGPGVTRDADATPTALGEDVSDWIAGRDYGAGRIVLLGFDARGLVAGIPPDDLSLARASRPILGAPDPRPWKTSDNGWPEQMRVSDQIGAILPQDAFKPPPLPAVLLGLFVYVLVVGPGDWLVLKRLRKERLTTLTFAGAVLVFTVIAYGASIFLFSTKAVVNRVITVQYANGGRPGRELVRFHDLAGYFEPISATRVLTHTMPTAFLGRNLPGLAPTGGVGAALPLEIRGADPLAPIATMEIAFRSQRTIHVAGAGTTGGTVDVVRSRDRTGRFVVTNSLQVPLADSWILLPNRTFVRVGPVAAGASATADESDQAAVSELPWSARDQSAVQWGSFEPLAPGAFRAFLARVVTSPVTSDEMPESYEALRRAGIVQRAPSGNRGLLVAVSDESPVPLAGLGEPGRLHVVISKEVELE